MPPGGHDHDRVGRLQARHHVVVEPLPGLIAERLGLGLFSVLDRVVDEQDVRAEARDRASYADTLVYAAFGQVPLGDFVHLPVAGSFGEEFLVFVRLADAFDVAAHPVREILAVGGRDDLTVWIVTEVPRREAAGYQLGLAVPRWGDDEQPRDLVAGDGFQRLADASVVEVLAVVALERVVREPQQAAAGCFAPGGLSEFVGSGHNLRQRSAGSLGRVRPPPGLAEF